MRNFNIIAIVITLFFYITLTAQVNDRLKLPEIIPPSPTVSNLMNFEEVPIDYHTGQPDISIPIYTKSLGSGLTLPIVLKYNTAGLKIDSRAGWTGTCWSLDAGGVISRTVRGYPDDLQKNHLYDNAQGVFHLDDFWNFENLSNSDKQEFLWNARGTNLNKYDTQPDLYQISMPGFSGRFVIIKSGGSLVAKQLDKSQNIKIDIIWGTNMAIRGFIVIDAHGNKFVFGGSNDKTETSLTNSVTFAMKRQVPPPNVAPENKKELPALNSAWMLSSINTSNNVALAMFDYENSEEKYKSPTNSTYNDFDSPIQPFSNDMINMPENAAAFRPISVVSYNNIICQTKKLSKITFRDKTGISFISSAQGSHPETDGKYLTQISLTKFENNAENTARTYNLQYYTTPNGRLFLMAIRSGNEFKHTLEYFDKDNFANANEKIDNWGYTSGDYRLSQQLGHNSYDVVAYKKGTLSRIIQNGGGTKEFSWGQHTYSHEGVTRLTEADFDSNYLNSKIANYSYAFSAYTNGTSSVPSQNINITHDQYVQVEKNILPRPSSSSIALDSIAIFEVQFQNSSGNVVQRVELTELTKKIFVPKGIYKIVVDVITPKELIVTQILKGYINIQYTEKVQPQFYNHYCFGGGLRIESVRLTEKYNNEFNSRLFNYRYMMEVPVTFPRGTSLVMSSGAIDSKGGVFGKTHFDFDREYVRITPPNAPGPGPMLLDIGYRVRSDQNNLQLTRGGYVGYKRVAVTEGNSIDMPNILNGTNNNGYTEYLYTNAIDAPYSEWTFNFPYIERPSRDHLRGWLKEKTVYNALGAVLEKTLNEYEPISEPVITSFIVKPMKCQWLRIYWYYDAYIAKQPNDPALGYNPQVTSNCGPTPMEIHTTAINATGYHLKSTTTRQYFQNSADPVVKKTDYTYNPINYQIATQTDSFKEGGQDVTLKTEYQYPVGGFTDYFEDYEEPVINSMGATYNMINKPVVEKNYKNGSLLNTVVTAYQAFGVDLIQPSRVATLKGGMPNNVQPEDRLRYTQYNEIGNVTKVAMAGDTRITHYVWGYRGTLPIAKIDGFDNLYIDYSHVNSAIAASDTGDATTLDSALENLRNQTAGNQVTTLIHDTVDGVKKVTDPKGIEMHYSYDYLGRLLSVKDRFGKLLAEYKYNFKDLF